jgi:spore coat polysaccharide biosynthesis protein SpsF
MKTVLIAQARMGSTRLPGKVMKDILKRPMLEHFIRRLKMVKNADDIVIATPGGKGEEPIRQLCERLKVNVFNAFKGSQEDVLSRYYEAAKHNRADVIVRITSDCPVIDPEIIDNMIKMFLDSSGKADYLSNALKRTYPRGLDTEVFSFNALERACNEAEKDYEREHVTSYIYEHPERFRLLGFESPVDYSDHRWTVDTVEDFELITKIYEALYPHNEKFLLKDILELFKRSPQLAEINREIRQKKL